MASSKFSSIITILFICTLSLSFGSISCKNDFVTNQAALFVFGDSLFEAGNNNYFDSLPGFKSNYWPYGKTTFQFPTGRVSDGRIMIDFIGKSSVLQHLLTFKLFLFRQKKVIIWLIFTCVFIYVTILMHVADFGRCSWRCLVTIAPTKPTTWLQQQSTNLRS